VPDDHQLVVIDFCTGDPFFSLTRYDLSENPDIHFILARAWMKYVEEYDGSDIEPELNEEESFMSSFTAWENSPPEDIEKEFFPPSTGKNGSKTYCLRGTGNIALSAAISPGWLLIYGSSWG